MSESLVPERVSPLRGCSRPHITPTLSSPDLSSMSAPPNSTHNAQNAVLLGGDAVPDESDFVDLTPRQAIYQLESLGQRGGVYDMMSSMMMPGVPCPFDAGDMVTDCAKLMIASNPRVLAVDTSGWWRSAGTPPSPDSGFSVLLRRCQCAYRAGNFEAIAVLCSHRPSALDPLMHGAGNDPGVREAVTRAAAERTFPALEELIEQSHGQCGACGAAASVRCSRCKTVSYCDQKCQRMDWRPSHKVVCTAVKEELVERAKRAAV